MVHEKRDDDLDTLFAVARDDMPSAALQARVVEDALAVQAGQTRANTHFVSRAGWMAALARSLGGWPALSGVTAAGVLGLGLGFYAPDLVDSLSGGAIWSLSGNVAATPDIGGLWTEIGDV